MVGGKVKRWWVGSQPVRHKNESESRMAKCYFSSDPGSDPGSDPSSDPGSDPK